ncbi:MAG: glycoside hydrolase domain-containing protein, partial [Saprospiraceae bacterium]
GNTFTITNANPKVHTPTVRLNGNVLENKWISHEELMQGGTLEFSE